MSYNLEDKLVIAISSRALFQLEDENQIFEEKGLEEYIKYQVEYEDLPIPKGTGYPLVKSLLDLNKKFNTPLVEVVILSRNSPETGMRIFNSIESLDLDITRGGFTGGEDTSHYLKAFEVDLFLSKNEENVRRALKSGTASALLYDPPVGYEPDLNQIRIAFDADAVVFSDESERIYQKGGLDAFLEHERLNSEKSLLEGPFGKLLKLLSKIKELDDSLIKIAIVTARNSPAHKRILLTLREWGVKVDEIFFLGGIEKKEILKSFNAHIFFDDQDSHVKPASEVIPSSRVPSNIAAEEKKS